jgi:hypothetical protein
MGGWVGAGDVAGTGGGDLGVEVAEKLMMIVDDVGDGWKLFESAVLLGDVLTVCVGVNEVGMEVG